jgi:hypothetical protein
MQSHPLLRVTGHVVGSRVIEVPARTDEKTGTTYDAYSYSEVSVLVAGALNNAPTDGVTAIDGITDEVGGVLASTPDGTAVDLFARVYTTWRRYRGRSFPVAAFRFCGPVVAVAAATSSKAA